MGISDWSSDVCSTDHKAPKGASNSRSSDRHPPVARGHAEPAAERLAEGGQVAIAATQRDRADVERGFAQQPAGVVEPDLADIVADREAAPVDRKSTRLKSSH